MAGKGNGICDDLRSTGVCRDGIDMSQIEGSKVKLCELWGLHVCNVEIMNGHATDNALEFVVVPRFGPP